MRTLEGDLIYMRFLQLVITKIVFFSFTFIVSIKYQIFMGVRVLVNQVRKEKLGDRISALQQMVAPFGKV